jgi:hypothetical protein
MTDHALLDLKLLRGRQPGMAQGHQDGIVVTALPGVVVAVANHMDDSRPPENGT